MPRSCNNSANPMRLFLPWTFLWFQGSCCGHGGETATPLEATRYPGPGTKLEEAYSKRGWTNQQDLPKLDRVPPSCP